MTRILAIDDEPHVLAALRRSLRQRFADKIVVETFDDPLLALGRARQAPFDIVISDLRMPGADGVELLTLLAAVQPDSVRILLTGSADFASAQRAINDAGVFRYVCKPWDDAELAAHVEAALLHRTLQERAHTAQAVATMLKG